MLLLKLIEGFCSCRVVMTDPALDVNFCDDVTGYAEPGLACLAFASSAVSVAARMLQCEPQHDGLIARSVLLVGNNVNPCSLLLTLCPSNTLQRLRENICFNEGVLQESCQGTSGCNDDAS